MQILERDGTGIGRPTHPLVELIRSCDGAGAEEKLTSTRPVFYAHEGDLSIRDHPARRIGRRKRFQLISVGNLIKRRDFDLAENLIEGHRSIGPEFDASGRGNLAEIKAFHRHSTQRLQSTEPCTRGSRHVLAAYESSDRIRALKESF